jgi:hypothetical protein
VTVETNERDRTVSPFVEPWQPTQRAVIITAVAITLLVLLSATTFVVQRVWFTPESALSGYFGALADRDAEKALTYLTDGDSSDTSTAAGIIGSQSYVPPTGLKVQGIKDDSDDGKSRTATIGYSIGDSKYTAQVSLNRSEELSWGLFRSWRISDSRPTLQITSSTPLPVRVNGVSLPGQDGQELRTPLFPGSHVVDIAENPLLESDPVTVDVGFDDAEVELVTRMKATAQQTVEQQVKDYLNGCAVAAPNPEQNCPFSTNSSELSSVAWRIDKLPTIELRQSSSGEITVSTRVVGQASVTAKSYDGSPYTDSTPFSVEGAAVLDQGKVVFLPA